METNFKTAVDWLVERLYQCEPWYSGLDDKTTKHINHLIQSAKDFERSQIIEAYLRGEEKDHPNPTEYYRNTYGK